MTIIAQPWHKSTRKLIVQLKQNIYAVCGEKTSVPKFLQNNKA